MHFLNFFGAHVILNPRRAGVPLSTRMAGAVLKNAPPMISAPIRVRATKFSGITATMTHVSQLRNQRYRSSHFRSAEVKGQFWHKLGLHSNLALSVTSLSMKDAK